MPTDRQRREAERRRQRRRAQRRARRHRTRRRIMIGTSILGALVIAAVVLVFVVATGNDTSENAGKSTTRTPTTSAPSSSASAAPGTCTYTPTPAAARDVKVPAAKQPTKGTAVVAVQTTRGAMTFTLDRAKAPCAVGSFVSLTRQKYFDDTPCHRLTTAGIYVLQCGDPSGTGKAGPGYKFASELTGKERYTRGVLAMANEGPDTNGSQFFIVYKNTASLGPQYTIFGKVTTGLSVVDGVAAKGAVGGSDGKPKRSISIRTATVRG